jgi:hypothetical protein
LEDLQNLYNHLHVELYSCSIFYIPDELDDLVKLNSELSKIGISINDCELQEMVSNFLYLDEKSELKILLSTENLQETLTLKKLRLDGNIFKLVKLKSSEDAESTMHILEKYYQQLTFFTNSSSLLVKEFHQTFDIDDSEMYNLLQYQKTIFDAHYLEFFNQFKDFGEVEPKKSEIKKVVDKNFEDFILHENKTEIVKIIKNFPNLKGKNLRFLLEFLKEKKLLIINPIQKELYDSMQLFFEGQNIGKYQSIFDKKVFYYKDKKYLDAKSLFENKLNQFYLED